MNDVYAFLLIVAYVSGSIPFGKIFARFYGIDIQKKGSGNIGFANVNRVLGWKAGIPTLILDTLKGFLPTYAAYLYINESSAFFVGLLAIIGHIAPIWLRFHGGKGIATGLGVLIVLEPVAAILGAVVYVLLCLSTKISSYSSIVGLVVASVLSICFTPAAWWRYIILVAIACWTLRHNFTGKVPNYDI